VNVVAKEDLNASEWTHAGSGVAWKARLWFFLAVALLLGSVGGAGV
jgi:hypothetical protein